MDCSGMTESIFKLVSEMSELLVELPVDVTLLDPEIVDEAECWAWKAFLDSVPLWIVCMCEWDSEVSIGS